VVKDYEFKWFRSEIDLSELARLRMVEKWSLRNLCKHFNMPKTTLLRRVRQLEVINERNKKNV